MRRELMVFVWAVVCLLSVSSVAAVSRSEGRLKASLQARAKSPVDINIDEPHPKADMFYRIKEEVGRIENKDFTEGKIYSTAEKIQEYKKILSTTIDELRSLQDAIDWHEVHKNGTQQALKDAVSTYEKSHHRIKLLEATAKLLAKEVNELKFYREQAEKTNSSAQRDLNLMKYELASLNSSARARSRIDANAAVEEAARKVSSSYQNLVLGLKTVASTLGKNFTIDESNVEGFAEHVANLQKELSELDRQAGDMRNRAVEDVQKLVGDIKNQENREGSVTKIEEDIEKEKKEVAKYQELYDKVKVEYEK